MFRKNFGEDYDKQYRRCGWEDEGPSYPYWVDNDAWFEDHPILCKDDMDEYY